MNEEINRNNKDAFRSDEEIIQALSLSAPEAAKQLEQRIQEINKSDQDNYTAIILEI